MLLYYLCFIDIMGDHTNLQNLYQVYADLEKNNATKSTSRSTRSNSGNVTDDWIHQSIPKSPTPRSRKGSNNVSKKVAVNGGHKRRRVDADNINEDTEAVASTINSKRKSRFMWNDDLHLKFVAAVFDYGLKSVSPKVLLQHMEPVSSELNTEHIKSHLQKYRVHSQRSRDEFMAQFRETYAQAALNEKVWSSSYV